MPPTRVQVAAGDVALVIEPDLANAPGLSGALLASLPHATLAVHCATAGAEFCVPVPWFRWHENRRPPQPGDVGYASFGNYLCFYSGEMHAADGPTNVIGRLTSPPEALEALGRALLEHGARRATIQLVPERADVAALPVAPASTLGDASTSFGRVAHALLAASLDSPPADILALRTAPLPAMGNLAGRMQASGLLLAIAEVLFNARTQLVAPAPAREAIANNLTLQLGRYARWIEMAGMPATAGSLRAMERALAATPSSSRDDDAALVAALETSLVAVGRLRFWAEAIAPWHYLAQAAGDDTRWLPRNLLE